MPQLFKFLPHLEKSLDPVNSLLDLLKGQGLRDKDLDGTRESVIQLVDILTRVFQIEKPGSRGREWLRALKLLRLNLEFGLGGAFPRINRFKFAIQLALRICKPRLIDQGPGMCAAAAVAIQLARDRPYEYAEFAMKISCFGRALLGALWIEPSWRIRNGSNTHGLGECDYVVLLSIQGSQTSALNPVTRLAGGITVGQLCRHLQHSGYEAVEDWTFSNRIIRILDSARVYLVSHIGPRAPDFIYPWNTNQKRAILQQMAKKLDAGRRVIMRTDGEIADPLIQLTHRKCPTLPNHVTYVNRVILHAQTLDIKLYSDGSSLTRIGVDIEVFLSHYGGFVSWDDRRVAGLGRGSGVFDLD